MTMKKIIITLMAVVAIGTMAQAQIGRAVTIATGNVRSTVQKNLGDKLKNAAQQKLTQNIGKTDLYSPSSPEYFKALYPDLPTEQQIVDYAVEKSQNPASVKLLVSHVTRFNGRVALSSSKVYSSITSTYNLDSAYMANQLRQLGIDPEEYYKLSEEEQEAYMNKIMEQRLSAYGLTPDDVKAIENMSDEEAQQYLAQHANYNPQADPLLQKQMNEYKDKYSDYQKAIDLYSNYTDVDDRVREILNKAHDFGSELWSSKYAGMGYDADILSQFFKEYAPVLRNALTQAQSIRINDQLPIAVAIDEEVRNVALKSKQSVPVLFSTNMATQLALAYLEDAYYIRDMFMPSK